MIAAKLLNLLWLAVNVEPTLNQRFCFGWRMVSIVGGWYPDIIPKDQIPHYEKVTKYQSMKGGENKCQQLGGPHRSSLLVYSKQPIFGLTQEWLRELSFSRLDCGVHDRLHIYPMCEIFYFPWHRHQIEGTNGCFNITRD